MMKAIIFDFDNTLSDYVDLDIRCLQHVYAQTGDDGREDKFVSIAVEEIMFCHESIERKQMDPKALHDTRLKNTCTRLHLPWRDAYRNAYQKCLIENTVVYPHVMEGLQSLSREYALGIISNAYDGEEQRSRIAHSGVGALMKAIVIAGESGYSKPDPAIFKLMACKLNVESEECVYVGDSEYYDISGARAAGMSTIKIAYKQGAIAPSAADKVCRSVIELFDTLKHMGSTASSLRMAALSN
jgi:HAD superfamily hydrolase (TIGR01549 family)